MHFDGERRRGVDRVPRHAVDLGEEGAVPRPIPVDLRFQPRLGASLAGAVRLSLPLLPAGH